MTARSYRDLRVSSPNGTLVLEALSPDNGNDLLRDGEHIPGDDTGYFQRNFRYQLLRADNETVVWERWQSPHEKSPVCGVVSDEGYVVLRTHRMHWGAKISCSSPHRARRGS
ncbi:Hypothetical protein A7982_04192 [Minicystis rosea]|nr:Hypothetical protein A7982_04192 [Minicystis rosea]